MSDAYDAEEPANRSYPFEITTPIEVLHKPDMANNPSFGVQTTQDGEILGDLEDPNIRDC